MKLARLEKLPDWPARMTAEIAAAYMGIGMSTFLARYRDSGVQEGHNVLWARIQLDSMIAKQFSMPQPAGRAANEDSTWDDLP